jgi:hypothetical protein
MNELSAEARELLREARSFDEPSAGDAERVHASVLAKVGIAVGAGAAVVAATKSIAASPAAALGATLFKVGTAVVLAGGLATASYVAWRSPAVNPAPVTIAEPRVPHAAPETPDRETASALVPSATSDVPRALEPPVAPPAKAVRARPSAPPASDRARAPRATPDLEGEARLLEQADADLRRGDANAALSRLAEHATRYPSGALREEREGVRVVALCRAGREAEGKAAAQRFLARSPHSALATRIRAACGE